MATASFDFLFEETSKINRQALLQGDLLVRTRELAEAIGEAHSYYATARDYSHFLVLTQSCDLVRRRGTCKARYITICAVRPLSLAVAREFQKYINPIEGCPIPTGDIEKNILARQFLERVVHNTVDNIFFIPRGSTETVQDHLCAFLPLSIALRADHYETLLNAKVGQVREIFQAKIGSLTSSLYGKIGTPDIHDRNDKAAVDGFMKEFFEDLGYSSVVWLTPFQRRAFENAVSERVRDKGGQGLDEPEVQEILESLPEELGAVADRVLQILSGRGYVENDPETLKKARNLLINDRQYRQMVKR